ncbi:hypothetical protein COU80_01830 [Candidatus Peregrinibacteria bacterium CG10_big_fil_rev_8_21_14_0_10_55_24]|nr:MAG: hypothetical protein COU80_01830 [Candidatus Peregrinibacteria bacterium CG10_big_fil_rev_8_21_14_0_10_55_24]
MLLASCIFVFVKGNTLFSGSPCKENGTNLFPNILSSLFPMKTTFSTLSLHHAAVRLMMGLTGVLLLSLLVFSRAEAANRYWAGTSSGNWEDTANWSALQKGPGGASVPGDSDVAILSTSGGLVHLMSSVRVGGLILAPTWSGSLVQGTGSLAVLSSGIRVGSGRIIGGNAPIALSGSYTQTGGIVSGIMDTFTISGSLTITKGSGSSYSTFTSTGAIILDGVTDQTFTVGANVTKTFSGITLQNAGGGTADDIIMDVSGGLTLQGNLTITTGSLDLSTNDVTLDVAQDVILANSAQAAMSGATMTLAGDLTVRPLATFTNTMGTVTFDGTTQTLSGSVTFHNLTKSVSAAETFTIGEGSVIVVTNTLTMNGAADELLALRSSLTDSQWMIDAQSTRTISYLDVQDSNSINATYMSCTTGCVDSKNNTFWTFTTASTSTSTTTTETAGSGGGGGRRSGGSSTTAAATAALSTASLSSSSAAANVGGPALDSVRGLLKVSAGTQSFVFKDVPVAQWFAPFVSAVVSNGIASGYSDAQGNSTGEYGPGNSVTYAEIAKMALELANKDVSAVTGAPANRSAKNQWSAKYIKLAETMHMSAFGSSLDVNTAAPRGAVVQTILEALELPLDEDTTTSYTDLSASHANARALATATRLGIISGDTDRQGNLKNTVRPDSDINRAEVAKILSVILEKGL